MLLRIGCFLALLVTSSAVADQPNIVFIISDDHDNEHLGATQDVH